MSTPTSTRAGAPSPLGTFVLGVRFLTELALIAAAAWAGAARTRSILLGIALGVLAAVVVAAVWGVWIAPTSRRRLPDPARLVLELVLFGAGAAGLVLAGRPVVAAVVGIVGAVTAVGVRFVPEEAARRPEPAQPSPTMQPSAAPPPSPSVSPSSQDAPAEASSTDDGITPAPATRPPLRRPRGRDRARPRS